MKKLIPVIALIIAGICLIAGLVSGKEEEYIRVHIRANSNTAVDQDTKYKVKNSVVSMLCEVTKDIRDKQEMMVFLEANLKEIETVANLRLQAEGSPYRAKASLKKEAFPARTYGKLTLSEGIYDALIIELGEGQGDNWWCVIFPQLCFVPYEQTDQGSLVYESKIKEIINKILEGKK